MPSPCGVRDGVLHLVVCPHGSWHVAAQDDVVVPTADSGLIGKAIPYEDKFDHWPEDSKKNKVPLPPPLRAPTSRMRRYNDSSLARIGAYCLE